MVAFILNVFHIISVKQEMDHISDQLVKQIQLNGGTNADTGALFSYLAAPLSEVEGLTYQVSIFLPVLEFQPKLPKLSD